MRCLTFGSVTAATTAALLLSTPALAHEEPFGYLRGAQVEPKGEWELTQWVTGRIGKESGRYLGMDVHTELEYGVSDRFQTALYLISNYHSLHNAAGGEDSFDDRNRFGVSGTSLEMKYQVTNPETSPFGFAIYFEPGYSTIDAISGERTQEIEAEIRFILQKNFLKGRLITLANLVIEPEWERDGGEWESELWIEGSLGASWALNDHWRVGLEGRVRSVFPEADLSDSEFVAVHVGPTVFYTRSNWFASFTVLPQVWGWPDARGKGGFHTDESERLELRLKFGVEF